MVRIATEDWGKIRVDRTGEMREITREMSSQTVKNLPVPVAEEISDLLDELLLRRKKTKIATVSAVLTWFCQADPILQTVALGEIDSGMEKPYADALRRMADRIEAGSIDVLVVRAEPGTQPPSPPSEQSEVPPKKPKLSKK